MIVKERSVSEHSNRPLDRIGRRADRIARQVQPSLKPSPSPKCHQVPPAQEVHQRLLHSTWLCGAWCLVYFLPAVGRDHGSESKSEAIYG